MLGLVALLLGGAPALAPPASAATMYGHDISWPQCPTSVGGNGLPMPPTTTQFVVIGLTRGLPFTENPCVASQVSWTRTYGKPSQAYTIPAFPTAAQLTTYASSGPWASRTRAGQLSNVGYAEGRFALATLSRIGYSPQTVWIDVEPRPAQPWPVGTTARQRENRYVVEGVMRAFRDAGRSYGLYSFTSGWADITGSWRLPGVPVWATAGRLDYPAEATDRCIQPSFSGGHVYLSQWYDDTRDYDLTCGTYAFTPLAMPPSSLSDSTAEFNGDWNNDLFARLRTNGDLYLYPGNGAGGWLPRVRLGGGWQIMSALDTVGDVTGDGAQDVVAREEATGVLWLYPGNGRGGWLPRVRIGTGWNVMRMLFGPGDVTGDQRPDLIAIDTAGTLWLYPGNGAGAWAPRIRIGGGWNVMDVVRGAGDFNGDGNPDLLARESATGVLWLYPGNGASGFGPRVRLGAGWNVMSGLATVGDFNGDRTADLLAREGSTGDLYLYPGTGTGGWLPRVRLGGGWQVMNALF
ncbi:MAG: FG-GAP-like repeat-containing protein [Blastococcus sp.]